MEQLQLVYHNGKKIAEGYDVIGIQNVLTSNIPNGIFRVLHKVINLNDNDLSTKANNLVKYLYRLIKHHDVPDYEVNEFFDKFKNSEFEDNIHYFTCGSLKFETEGRRYWLGDYSELRIDSAFNSNWFWFKIPKEKKKFTIDIESATVSGLNSIKEYKPLNGITFCYPMKTIEDFIEFFKNRTERRYIQTYKIDGIPVFAVELDPYKSSGYDLIHFVVRFCKDDGSYVDII